MKCGIRTYCAACEEEMIHRDHRQSHESASGFGQIMHREGPADMAFGDVDGYCEATVYPVQYHAGQFLLRILEHKQPDQEIGGAQRKALQHIDACIRHAIDNPPPGLRLHSDSGVYVIKGKINAEKRGRHKVNFSGPQVVHRLDGSVVFKPKDRTELFDWIRGKSGWTARNGQDRQEWRVQI